MSRPRISVVVPIYNEADCVEELVRRTFEVLDGLGCAAELVLVDDGSTDNSVMRIQHLQETHAGLRLIRLRRNQGQTTAMNVGFQAARGEVVVSMDGDLQNDPADIPRLLARIEDGYDVVCGWRKNRHDKLWSRKVPSRVANWLIARLTGIPIHDNGCSLKAYRSEVIQEVNLYAEQHRFIPARAGMLGARISEIVVTHHPRLYGVSKYGISRVWKVFLDLFVIKMLTAFALRPIRWFAWLSLPFLVLSLVFLAGAYGAMRTGGLSTVLLAEGMLLFVAGLQMGIIGMMGEHIVHAGRHRGAGGAPAREVLEA